MRMIIYTRNVINDEKLILFIFFRDQYLSACLFIRRFFALYAPTLRQVKRKQMKSNEMLMFAKYIRGPIFIHILILDFPKISWIMSESMFYIPQSNMLL